MPVAGNVLHSTQVWLDDNGVVQHGSTMHRQSSVVHSEGEVIQLLDVSPRGTKFNLELRGFSLANVLKAFG